MFETHVTLVGRVISDITERTVATGDKVCSFRIKAQERRYDREAQEWVDGDRIFARVTCWRKLAEGVAASLARGDHVMAAGRLYVSEYDTPEGQRRSSVELEARAIGPDLSRGPVQVQRSGWLEPAVAERTEEVVAPGVAA